MKKSERTKAHILESVAPVFNKKGFAGTSLADLTEASGLTKGGLYGNFATKEDIAVQAFRYAARKTREHVDYVLAAKSTPTEQIMVFLEHYRQYVFQPPVPGGCILLNTAVEADDNQPALKAEVNKAMKRFIKFIALLLQRAIDSGELTKNIDATEAAYNMFCAIEGAMMMARVQNSKKPVHIVVDYWKRQIGAWRVE